MIAGDVPAPLPPPPVEKPSDFSPALREYMPPYYPSEPGPVTGALLARLGDDDPAAILAAAEPQWQRYYESAHESEQPHLLLQYAAHWKVAPALSRTGLSSAQPPTDVHAMARGPRASAGATWFADLVVEAAERAGAPVAPAARVLDFGCSSGRVLRVLAAWRDDVEWIGCDPNGAATSWADAHLPGVRAFESPQEPPLPFDDASLDVVYAISVWSHFGESQAVRWLEEMHRIVKPGGALAFTTQGFPSLAFYLKGDHVTEEHACSGARALVSHGHTYFEAFGDDGDWGVKHPEWGMAYMSAEWLAARTTGSWSLQLFEPARVDANQDLVVLTRR